MTKFKIILTLILFSTVYGEKASGFMDFNGYYDTNTQTLLHLDKARKLIMSKMIYSSNHLFKIIK